MEVYLCLHVSVFSFFLPPFLKLLSLNSFLIIATRKKKQMIFQRHNPGLCLRILNDKDVLDESLPPLRKNISMARKNTMTKRRITERHWISRLGLISDRLLQLFLLTFPPPFLFSCLCVSLPMPTKMMRDAQRRARRKFSSVAPHFTARRCNVHFLTVANQVVVHRFAVYETFFPCLLSPTTNHSSLESIFNPSRQLLKFSLLVILCWNCYNILKFFF